MSRRRRREAMTRDHRFVSLIYALKSLTSLRCLLKYVSDKIGIVLLLYGYVTGCGFSLAVCKENM